MRTRTFFLVFLIALPLTYTAYWYVYGRERDLFEGTELKTFRKDLDRFFLAKDADKGESKRLSDIWDRRSALLAAASDGRFSLTPNGSGGSTLSGIFVSGKQDWITNRAYVHIRILEKRHCGEKLQNRFSDVDWEKNCASDPTHTVMDTVAGQAYQCFVGKVAYGETAPCHAETVLPFDPSKQSWAVSVSKVTGHPQDPLGVFD